MATSQREVEEVVLELLPEQGGWNEDAYLWVTDHSTRLIEFSDGYLEVLPMPTDEHQLLLKLLVRVFDQVVDALGGILLFAPLRLRLRDGKIREPDLLVLLDARDPRRQNRYWVGADLVLEVVSTDRPERDLIEKRREYEQAGITEYWIVNPLNRTITVLFLRDGTYAEHGIFTPGAVAKSVLLPAVAVRVSDLFAAV
jgi:Uma2 family endonuclease